MDKGSSFLKEHIKSKAMDKLKQGTNNQYVKMKSENDQIDHFHTSERLAVENKDGSTQVQPEPSGWESLKMYVTGEGHERLKQIYNEKTATHEKKR